MPAPSGIIAPHLKFPFMQKIQWQYVEVDMVVVDVEVHKATMPLCKKDPWTSSRWKICKGRLRSEPMNLHAFDHGQRRGDDLLAAVRIVGSYLAETPFACKEKTQYLLGYMLSVEGDDESRPFDSICFLLPMLCQITMEKEGCMLLASFEGHKTIVECLVKMIREDGAIVENNGTIFLACETILNLLLKMKELHVHLEEFQVVNLLRALSFWTEKIKVICERFVSHLGKHHAHIKQEVLSFRTVSCVPDAITGKSNDSTTIIMASCVCVVIFDLTSEEYLLSHSSINRVTIESFAQLIARSFHQGEMTTYDVGEHLDLQEIVSTGYNRWADRFPLVRSGVEYALAV